MKRFHEYAAGVPNDPDMDRYRPLETRALQTDPAKGKVGGFIEESTKAEGQIQNARLRQTLRSTRDEGMQILRLT